MKILKILLPVLTHTIKYVKISLIFWDFLKGLYTRYRRSLGWRWITTGARWYPAITMSSRSFPSARVQYNWWRCLQWWRWGFWSVWGGWRQFCSTCLRSYGLTFFCRQKKRWWQPKFNPKTDKFPLWDQNFNEKTRKFEIGFYFNWNFDEHRKDRIRIKFEEFARDTCIQMVEVDRYDPTYKNKISIKQLSFCASFVGRIHTEQMVSLGRGCEGGNLPLHEVRIFMNIKRYSFKIFLKESFVKFLWYKDS